MRRFMPFIILNLLVTISCVEKKIQKNERSEVGARIATPTRTCPLPMTAPPQTSVSDAISIDKGFSRFQSRQLQRALAILHRAANKDSHCNRSFRDIGDLKLLREFLDNSHIRIHYDPVQEYSDEGPTIAYTLEGSKRDIYLQPYAWRLNSRDLARALVHEFTHITLTPRPGQEGQAQLMEVKCGFRKRLLTPSITVTASPSPVPLLQSLAPTDRHVDNNHQPG